MDQGEKKYYGVKCKCGHVGRSHYIPIEFAVIACSKKEAAEIGRLLPRCKHHHKDCVLDVRELSLEEYEELSEANHNDPYLRCQSIQEQSDYDLSDRLMMDPCFEGWRGKREKEEQRHQVFKGKTRIRNPKKFARLNEEMEAYCY